MNEYFPIRCIGLIDDSLIEMSIKRIKRIKTERMVNFFTSIAATALIIIGIGIPVGISYYNTAIIGDSLHYEEPPCVIGNKYYQAIGSLSYEEYGLPNNPSSNMIDEYLGTYENLGGNPINIYSTTVSSTYNILLGENDGRFFYLLFIHLVNNDMFANSQEFLDFYGYSTSTNIHSMSIDGKNASGTKIIIEFWEAISDSKISSFDEYNYALCHSESSDDVSQDMHNNPVYIELNFGETNYLEIAYYPSIGFFATHDCYFKLS